MIRRGRNKSENFILKTLILVMMVLALLLAGSDFANSQESQFSDPFHLGNIQEMGRDADSQLELLEEDREHYLNCQKTFKEKGSKEAYLWASKILQKIEADLKRFRSEN